MEQSIINETRKQIIRLGAFPGEIHIKLSEVETLLDSDGNRLENPSREELFLAGYGDAFTRVRFGDGEDDYIKVEAGLSEVKNGFARYRTRVSPMSPNMVKEG